MMAKKGRVSVGADADLTIFDSATVIDRATDEGGAHPHVEIARGPGVAMPADGMSECTLSGNMSFSDSVTAALAGGDYRHSHRIRHTFGSRTNPLIFAGHAHRSPVATKED